MKIGELAEQLGITASAIRYYEKEGLIDTPERVSGQRVYSSSVLSSLKLIQLAQAAGFTISEIKILVDGYAEGKPLSDGWFEMASKKQVEVEQKIVELQEMKKVLDELVKCQCITVEACVDSALAEATSCTPNCS